MSLLPQLNENYKHIDGASGLLSQFIEANYDYIMKCKGVDETTKNILHEQYVREIPPELDPTMADYFIERAGRIYKDATGIVVDFEKDEYGNATKAIFKDYIDLEQAIKEFKDKINSNDDYNEACAELINKINDRKFNVIRYINYLGFKAYETVKEFNIKYKNELSRLDEYDSRLISATNELYSNITNIENEWKALLKYQEKVQNIARELCNKFFQN